MYLLCLLRKTVCPLRGHYWPAQGRAEALPLSSLSSRCLSHNWEVVSCSFTFCLQCGAPVSLVLCRLGYWGGVCQLSVAAPGSLHRPRGCRGAFRIHTLLEIVGWAWCSPTGSMSGAAATSMEGHQLLLRQQVRRGASPVAEVIAHHKSLPACEKVRSFVLSGKHVGSYRLYELVRRKLQFLFIRQLPST